MILLIDNYDSFTFNLYQMIVSAGASCQVVRNDKITISEIEYLAPEKIVLSPGPGNPLSAGITLSVIHHFAALTPIFGVCLGHQAIGQAFGAKVIHARTPVHGKRSKIINKGTGVFENLPPAIMATRYHSLIVDKASLPDCLEVTSETEDGLIMGLRHRLLPIEGVQFHPESIATERGEFMVKTFLQRVG